MGQNLENAQPQTRHSQKRWGNLQIQNRYKWPVDEHALEHSHKTKHATNSELEAWEHRKFPRNLAIMKSPSYCGEENGHVVLSVISVQQLKLWRETVGGNEPLAPREAGSQSDSQGLTSSETSQLHPPIFTTYTIKSIRSESTRTVQHRKIIADYITKCRGKLVQVKLPGANDLLNHPPVSFTDTESLN